MTELLQKKEFLAAVTIIEARNVIGLDWGGTSDPFVKVKCADQIQQTQKKYEQNSAVWNQTLTFPGIRMNQFELETFEINIELYDHNAILSNDLIGQYSIGLSTLYRNTNHEFYKTWITMWNRDNPNKVMGYLLISCFIVGPNERPPVHAADEDFDPDAANDSEEDEAVIAEKIENIKRAQMMTLITNPSVIVKKYQLTISIAMAQNLPSVTSDRLKQLFFVSARANGCVSTTNAKMTPKFNQRVQIPLFYPILNNKITMRVWHKTNSLQPNLFVASIPEQPCASDQFNLSKIMSQDGKMPFRWINLYGTPPELRNSKTKGKKEGSHWLGRVLIGFNIIPSERPTFQTQQMNPPQKMPKIGKYQLWIDIYSLIQCELIPSGNPVYVNATLGEFETEKIQMKYKESKKAYTFKQRQIETKFDIQIPADPGMMPDIFINVYTDTTFSNDVRVAYLRLQTRNCTNVKPKPNWLRLSSPYNDTVGISPGVIMANVQIVPWDKEKPDEYIRETKEKSDRIVYHFYYYIHQGFELASMIPVNKLNTLVDLTIGDPIKKGMQVETKAVKGRYPVWDKFGTQKVELERELLFEADMKITLKNRKSKFFGGFSNLEIGSFQVPTSSLMKYCDKPQFFNILNEDGQFMGQILGNFYLKAFYRDPKTRKQKDWKDIDHERQVEEMQKCAEHWYTVNIDLSILGIRNLIFKAQRPKLYFRLTTDSEFHQDLEEDKEEERFLSIDKLFLPALEIEETQNPNFGEVIGFKNVKLRREPMLWPYIEIIVEDEVKEKALIHSFSGCETCFTTISLVDYAQDILSSKDFAYAQEQLRRNQDQLQLVQKQVKPDTFLKTTGRFVDMNQLTTNTPADNPDEQMPEAEQDGEGGELRQSMMPNGMVVNQLAKGSGNPAQRKQGTINLFREREDADKDNSVDLSLHGGGSQKGEGDDDRKFDLGNADDSFDIDDILNGEDDAEANDLESGIIIGTDDIQSLEVSIKDKTKEQKVRDAKIEVKKSIIKALMIKIKKTPPEKKLDKIKLQIEMMGVTEQMENLIDEPMTEEKFWGMLALDDGDGAFDYQREILKEAVYEVQKMKIPYQHLPLFVAGDWASGEPKPIIQVEGILRSGTPSNASIKAQVRLTLTEDAESEDSFEVYQREVLNAEFDGDKKKDDAPQASEVWEEVEFFCLDFLENHPFDMFNKNYLQKLNEDRQSYIIRVYLLSCQNLTATGVALDIKSRMAGMTALSTASPFPVLKIGDGENVGKSTKFISAEEDLIENTLSPQFLQMYEMHAHFPEDWKLEISIFDKGMFGNGLIGQTQIDLENRLFANLLYMARYSATIQKDKYKTKYSQCPGKFMKKKRYYKSKMDELTKMNKKLRIKEQFLLPIEYRELTHPAKSTPQGIIELWTEVIEYSEATKIPIAKIQTIKKETFEIRLIIWETRYVPLIDGDSVDIFVKVCYDPTGWPEDEVEKRTDVHKNSKSGWGHFNWRMKFALETPIDFPRLKFFIHDQGVVTDEMIGESTINLKGTINKLLKEGEIEVPKTYISFSNPNKPGEDRGIMMFSMTIIPLEDALGEPVGEAQEEPNENPFLKKPTAGRGAAGFSFPSISLDFDWNPFGKFLYYVLALAILGLFMAAGFMLK